MASLGHVLAILAAGGSGPCPPDPAQKCSAEHSWPTIAAIVFGVLIALAVAQQVWWRWRGRKLRDRD